MFLIVPINAPVSDGIYQFKSVKELEFLFLKSGLSIEDSLYIPYLRLCHDYDKIVVAVNNYTVAESKHSFLVSNYRISNDIMIMGCNRQDAIQDNALFNEQNKKRQSMNFLLHATAP